MSLKTTKAALPGLENESRHEYTGNYTDVKIDGLEALAEEGVFRLHGVKHFNIDWSKVTEQMVESGIDKKDAYMLVDEFADTVHIRMLAKALATRMITV